MSAPSARLLDGERRIDTEKWFSVAAGYAGTAAATRPTNKLGILSLVPQGFDGIQPRGFSRGVISKKDADRDRKHGCDHDRLERHLNGPMQRLSHHIRTNETEEHSRRAAD